jgi:hypothetical protein
MAMAGIGVRDFGGASRGISVGRVRVGRGADVPYEEQEGFAVRMVLVVGAELIGSVAAEHVR